MIQGDWSNPWDVIGYGKDYTGRPLRFNRRTAVMVDHLREAVDGTLWIFQGSYSTGTDASALTHAAGGAIDCWATGMSGLELQALMRRRGWAAWWRYPPSFDNHVHAIALGDKTVHPQARAQIFDYYAAKDGLFYHRDDPTWHPSPQPIFDYAKWLEEQVTSDDIDRIVNRVVRELKSDFANIADAVWAADVIPVPDNVGDAAARKDNPTNGAANALSRTWKAATTAAEGVTP